MKEILSSFRGMDQAGRAPSSAALGALRNTAPAVHKNLGVAFAGRSRCFSA